MGYEQMLFAAIGIAAAPENYAASEPAGAALLAAKMLGLVDAAVRERVADWQQRAVERILEDDMATT